MRSWWTWEAPECRRSISQQGTERCSLKQQRFFLFLYSRLERRQKCCLMSQCLCVNRSNVCNSAWVSMLLHGTHEMCGCFMWVSFQNHTIPPLYVLFKAGRLYSVNQHWMFINQFINQKIRIHSQHLIINSAPLALFDFYFETEKKYGGREKGWVSQSSEEMHRWEPVAMDSG